MKNLSHSLLFLISVLRCVSSSTPAAPFGIRRGFPSQCTSKNNNCSPASLFGVPRGGSDGATKMYPALTKEEVISSLEHIPVFAVTDADGMGVVLKTDNETSVFYFFMTAEQANATLDQLIESKTLGDTDEMKLKVSAFSLGQIWFSLLNGDAGDAGAELQVKMPTGKEDEKQTIKGVQYRLVPDTRDLMGARMMSSMSPEDAEKLKGASDEDNRKLAQEALQKALTESTKFKETYNEIPVFGITQMRVKANAKDAKEGEEPKTMLPMYFNLQAMISTWQQFMASLPDQGSNNVEPAISLLSLHELIKMMMSESEIDWRAVILIPSNVGATPGEAGPTTGAATMAPRNAEEVMSEMGGATLGDI